MFIRVRDKETGHHYDVPEQNVNEETQEVLTRFEPARYARSPKLKADLTPEESEDKNSDPASAEVEPADEPAAVAKKGK